MYLLEVNVIRSFQHTQLRTECVDLLNLLIASTSDAVSKIQCLSAVSNVFVEQKNYRLALYALNDVWVLLNEDLSERLNYNQLCPSLQDLDDDVHKAFSSTLIAASKIEILSRQGRIFLQIGALSEASLVFQSAEKMLSEVSTALNTAESNADLLDIIQDTKIIQAASHQIALNEGLLLFSQKNYSTAIKIFTSIVDSIDSEEKSRYGTDVFMNDHWLSVDDLVFPAMNNIALCALYTCQLEESIASLENLVRRNPLRYLTDDLAFNLCTLYELVADGVGRRKRVLQVIASKFSLHDISPSSFRNG